MSQILEGLRHAGHPVTARKEDRQILSEADLADLFAGQGFTVRCGGQLRLYRSAAERLSFFQIPAVTQEVFPDVDRADAAQVIASLPVAADLPAQERTVYAFIADKQ